MLNYPTRRVAVLAAVCTLTLAGCATQQGTNTAIGAGAGAAGGALIGALVGHHQGAAIGGALGAAAGGAIGYNWTAIHQKLSGATAGTGAQVTEQPDGSLKLNIPSAISFDTNSYAVKQGFVPVLNQLAQTLVQHPELSAKVIGFTDSTGRPTYNVTLSQNRAQSVLDALIARGVAANRLSAEGLGAAQPVGDNATDAGRAQNRRVEIYLRSDIPAPASTVR